jgi:uncharacterized membrane protein YhiD involved in acid resistance
MGRVNGLSGADRKSIRGGAKVKGLLKTKTFWMSIAGIATAIGLGVSGEAGLTVTIMSIVGCLIAIFIRDALPKPL